MHARNTEAGAELAAVDDGGAAGCDGADQVGRRLRQPMAEEDQPVRFFPFQHERIAFFAFLVVLRIAEQHRVAFTLRGVLDALQNQREERIRDVRHGDQELAGSEHPEILGGGVRFVREPFDGLQHFAARGRCDDIGLTEDARDRGRGHASTLGDFVDIRHVGFRAGGDRCLAHDTRK